MTGGAAGVDVGGTKILGVTIDGAGEILATRQVETPADGEEILDAVAGVVLGLWDAVPAAAGGGVGVGMPGLVDPDGILRYAPNLPAVVDLDCAGGLARRLTAATGVDPGPVVVDNDATCATAAEHAHGAARGAADALMVTFGTGIGGGVVVGGAIVRGANNFAGELGHVVVDAGGPPCSCGKQGCWEACASGTALGRMAREEAAAGRAPDLVQRAGSVDAVQGEHVVDSAAAGDPAAAAILERYAGWVAVGLSNLANIFDPDVVVLGGGIVRGGDVVLEPIRAAFRLGLMGTTHRPEPAIVAASRGPEAGAVGAAVLAAAAAAAGPRAATA